MRAPHLPVHSGGSTANYADCEGVRVNLLPPRVHLAWRMLDQPFAMPAHLPHAVRACIDPADSGDEVILLQRDFDGESIFCHRTGGPAKWTAWGRNLRVPGARFEEECLEALELLRRRWGGRVSPLPPHRDDSVATESDMLCARYFRYCRIGSDERVLELLSEGRIGRGRGGREGRWRFDYAADGLTIVLEHGDRITCSLRRENDGVWRGQWAHHERMPVEMISLLPQA